MVISGLNIQIQLIVIIIVLAILNLNLSLPLLYLLTTALKQSSQILQLSFTSCSLLSICTLFFSKSFLLAVDGL